MPQLLLVLSIKIYLKKRIMKFKVLALTFVLIFFKRMESTFFAKLVSKKNNITVFYVDDYMYKKKKKENTKTKECIDVWD